MKSHLLSEIEALIKRIAITSTSDEVETLHQLSKELYEKLTVLTFLNSNCQENKSIQNVEEVNAYKIKEEAVNQTLTIPSTEHELISTLDENLFVSDEPMDERLIEPAIEKIKDIVAQMPPETHQIEDLIQDVVAPSDYTKNDINDVTPQVSDFNVTTDSRKSLNDKLKQAITIGLNDRIAFVKHLFNGSTEDFNRVISQLNTLSSELEALEFLNSMVKPEYDNWEGKEEYEQRFLSFIEGKYA